MPLVHTAIDISQVVDNRNKKLWEDILQEYSVSVEYSVNEEHGLFTKNNDAIIYVPRHELCINLFTHEFLHIYIRLKQVFIGAGLQLSFRSSPLLSPIWVIELCKHVGNCLDHIKMFPVYRQLGFKKEKFLLDYYQPKCTDQEMNEIKTYYKIGNKILPNAAEHFIAKFFAMKADPNNSFNYDGYISELQELDEELYDALNSFLQGWIVYDIEVNDPVVNSYHALSFNFEADLEMWAKTKEFFGA